jgi:agmatine deiminase
MVLGLQLEMPMQNISRRKMMLTGSAAMLMCPPSAQSAILSDYHMPLESDPHERTFMQWPVSVDVYGDRLLKRVQSSVAEIAKAISKFEEVVLLVAPEHKAQAFGAVGGGVTIWDIATDDLWCRDSGPTFVRNGAGELAVSQIQFNGWGNKQTHQHDEKIAGLVAQRLGLPFHKTSLVGEQGGLEHDGAGLVLAHASSWVNPNRNFGSKDEVGQKILDAIGGQKMLWAPGIVGADITDYHIDALARFVGPGKVLIQLPAKIDPDDPWSKSAYETLDVLRAATTVDGKALEIIVLPEPVDIRSAKKDFVASYVNYLVCNGAVICSQFGDKAADGGAKEMMQQLYHGREIVTLNTDPIGESGGGIHCSTQQQPKAQS